jgi:hypothetical protein
VRELDQKGTKEHLVGKKIPFPMVVGKRQEKENVFV